MTCAHERTADIAETGFTGSVNPWDENRAAHGNICVTEECRSCGARRSVNVGETYLTRVSGELVKVRERDKEAAE